MAGVGGERDDIEDCRRGICFVSSVGDTALGVGDVERAGVGTGRDLKLDELNAAVGGADWILLERSERGDWLFTIGDALHDGEFTGTCTGIVEKDEVGFGAVESLELVWRNG